MKKSSKRVVLENEAGIRRRNPSPQLVGRVVRGLDSGEGNSFCSLTRPGNTFYHCYVQTLRGLNGWHLEWREIKRGDVKDYRHYRASRPQGSRRKRYLRKSDEFVSPGQKRDLLGIEAVVQCFLAFLRREERPGNLRWRELRI